MPEVETKKHIDGVVQNTLEKEQKNEEVEEKKEEKKEAPSHTLPLPFSQRQQKSKLDNQFEKFMKSFQ